MANKFVSVFREETYGFDPRWQLTRFLMLPFPRYTAGRVRTQIMRMMGYQVGRGTMIWDIPMIIGGKNLHTKFSFGNCCLISLGCYLDVAAPIRIGNHVGLSPQTMIITGNHDTRNPKNRVGELVARPVTICDGVWLGVRCIIFPGVTVGEGAVVGAGAVVTKDIPAHTLYAGVPAVFIRDLPVE